MSLNKFWGRALGSALALGFSTIYAANGALASTGCSAVNSGVFNINQNINFAGPTVNQAGFEVGDQISVTVVTSNLVHYDITSGATNLLSFFHPADGATLSFTVGTGQTSLTLTTAGHGVGVSVLNATCVPGIVASNDSDKARAVQNLGSRLVSRNSSNAISDATHGAITGHLMQGPQGPQNSSPNNPGATYLGGPNAPADEMSNLGRRTSERAASPRMQMDSGKLRLWTDVRGTGIADRDDSTGRLGGSQVNTVSGVSLQVRPGFVVGALSGYERFDYEFKALNGKFSGNGYTGGLFVGGKLHKAAWYSLVASYTRLGYDVSAGTAVGDLAANRWMLSGTLAGRIPLGTTNLFAEPSASFLYVRESQDGWTDTLAAFHDGRTVNEGRVSLGSKIGTTWRIPGAIVTPHVGAFADYYFGSKDEIPATGIDGLGMNHSWSLRTVAGISATMPEGYTLNLDTALGGIGDNYQTVSVRGGFSSRF